MKTTTYICDICKNSVGEKELITLKVTTPNCQCLSYTGVTKDVCINCLKKRGFTFEENDIQISMTKNEKTMSDKLIDILDDLGVAFTE